MTILEIPTPALLLDLDIFTANLALMAAHARATSQALRPHAKAHKCVEIAKRQIAAGAAGVCVATLPEAELMVAAGILDVLLTSPIADPRKAARAAALAPHLAVVVDHPQQVSMYAHAAAQANTRLKTLVDLDVGDHRTGIAPGAPALQLARQIVDTPALSFRGLQAYSVRASHLPENEDRAGYSARALQPAVDTKALIESHGIPVPTLTGASTGSYKADSVLTELQAGSYALMDVAYARIGGLPFGHALTVLATVVSANHPARVTVDAGFKAFSTDRPFGPQPFDLPGARYEWAGDEFGFLLDAASRPNLGDRIRFIPPHCDPTVNLYDRIHVHRGDEVVEVWQVKAIQAPIV